jgi:small subunit ribosomal protein S24e
MKILSQKSNPLLRRNEVVFDADHSSEGQTPSRSELRKNLGKVLKIDPSRIFVRQAITKTGQRSAIGYANIYETPEQARLVESQHVIARNSPPDTPQDTQTPTRDKKGEEELLEEDGGSTRTDDKPAKSPEPESAKSESKEGS